MKTKPSKSLVGDLDSKCTCPTCGGSGLVHLYSIDDIPVHSTIQLADRAKAMNFPKGNLTLSYCP